MATRKTPGAAPGPTGEAFEDWCVDRSPWRWTVHRYLAGGAVQLICPQCAGRVKTSAKTYKPDVIPSKNPVPYLAIDDEYEYCCDGLVTVPVDKLDSWQRIPSARPRGEKSYKGRRNNSETKNSMVGDKGAFAVGWCRVFNRVAITLGALAKVIAHNLAEASGSAETNHNTKRPSPKPNHRTHLPTRHPPLRPSHPGDLPNPTAPPSPLRQ